MLFLDFDFLVLLEVVAGVFSDVAESMTVAVLLSAIFCTMLLLLVVGLVVPTVASVGNKGCSLVALVP